MRHPTFQRGALSLALAALLFVALAGGAVREVPRHAPAAPSSFAAHACTAHGDARPVLAESHDAPSLVAAKRTWRADETRDRRTTEASRSSLHDALAARVAAAFAASPAIPHARPSFGLAVPSCHAQQRWWLAHATSTSPA